MSSPSPEFCSVNGQSTDETLAAAERLGDTLVLRAKIMPRWGELQLQAEDGDAQLICATEADPAGVDMDVIHMKVHKDPPKKCMTCHDQPVSINKFLLK